MHIFRELVHIFGESVHIFGELVNIFWELSAYSHLETCFQNSETSFENFGAIMATGACDPDCLVQPPNSWIAPKSTGEGASSLFGGWPGSLENVSCSSATPDLHWCNPKVAPVQETFSRLSGPPPKRLLAPSPIDLRGIQEI